jgi:hypothetical protein
VVALVMATAAVAASWKPADAPVVVPGVGLGGVRLGASEAEVRAAWGSRFGRCRNCRSTTWYFNARPFAPEGVGVEFRAGRAVALFTLWSPSGWRTTRGLAIGDPVERVAEIYGGLERRRCGRYDALVSSTPGATTAFYVLDDRIWGFAVGRPAVPTCRR